MKTIENINELQNKVLEIEDFKIKSKECELLLGYFEGHDYIIKSDGKNLFVVDAIDETDMYEDTLLGIVTKVQEWNSELIEDTNKEINKLYETLDEHEEFAKLMSYLLNLTEDSKSIDGLVEILTREPMTKSSENEIVETIKSILNYSMVIGSIEEIDINNIEVMGSRKIGRHRENSDLDIMIEYKNNIKEYIVLNMLNELEIKYDSLNVDFFPKQKSVIV
ncbi:MAG: nucleotidyltransferase domain-containing protein [Paraclostridium sp.]